MSDNVVDLPIVGTKKNALEVVTVGTKSARVKRRLTSRTATVVSLVIAILWTLPTFGLFVSSFRPAGLITTTGWWTILQNPGFTLDNYKEVLLSTSQSSPQLGAYFVNSLAIAIPATIFPLVIASMAAYAFAWIKFKGSGALFVLVFALQIVPLQLALIPLLQMFTAILKPGQEALHQLIPMIPAQNYLPVWIAHTIFALPLAIFLLHNFISEIPSEVIEAARVDGASHGQVFFRIVLPLAVPALASFAIFQFLWVWNDLLVALIFSGGTPDVAPLTQRLAELTGTRGQDWQRLTAAAFVSLIVPLIVFFSLQRYFVRGLLAGSTKG
ncbi:MULTISPECIES: carbohydrate ABC transporter permease [Cryobacterium]|jgi:alpha-glucoside transport system permease protein|uniref:Carbohydrate ABC transporter permease n=3 Tax=Cryobacterium TaxID=69578 RepID=A0AA41QRL2_9MICO|nr:MULTISPECIES: carbohydrate ABC transporter permease [Cryobacterium]MCI4656351.1 carbohydrate ABC transporter permease [Cryobacterium zhongshanensis]MDY7529280.1 carbohydrate ABC transporter permease [Cryobacterium sp. 10C2]MDY7558562.1 carbohydrate ABC transporter permease [Cryobacterium sp. 10C3]MEB0004850.1 carbohydrate ABC transporter permease [Cryobacterium sp. RTC2.1]MEB0203567.1 carbohydrate ABC transporter permease [Cryobacterium sp. 5I3]